MFFFWNIQNSSKNEQSLLVFLYYNRNKYAVTKGTNIVILNVFQTKKRVSINTWDLR
jgi:hypothetical protein